VLPIVDMCTVGDETWAITEYNGIFVKGKDWSDIRHKGYLDWLDKWRDAPYCSMLKVENRIYLAPYATAYCAYIDLDTGEIAQMPLHDVGKWLWVRGMEAYEGKVFYLLGNSDMISEYDPDTRTWAEHCDGIRELKAKAKERIYEDGFACVSDGRYLWVIATYTNYILRLDMANGEHQLCQVGEEGYGYSGIADDGNTLWLAEVHSGMVIQWNKETSETVVYQMPEEYECWQRPYGRHLACSKLLLNDKYVFALPGLANGMARIDKETGEVKLLLKDFVQEKQVACNGYHSKYMLAINYSGWYDDNTIWVRRESDKAVALMNVETGDFSVVYPSVSEETLKGMLKDQHGFGGYNGCHTYYRAESRLFSLESFLKDLEESNFGDAPELQALTKRGLAANPDGTCGEKVHQYIMGEFDRQIFKITSYV